jgi:hypothetical protein
MRKLVLLSLLAFAGCQPKPCVPETIYEVREDTTQINAAKRTYDSTLNVLKLLIRQRNSEYDSVRNALILSEYRHERVKYYVRICQRNKSQTKFLVGWIRRAENMN